MATLKSTMNAPLTDAEEDAILEAWAKLLKYTDFLGTIARDETVTMLDAAADLVGIVSELRTAVYNGWHRANARAFPTRIVGFNKKVADDIKKYGTTDMHKIGRVIEKNYTKEEIQAALKILDI
jgi:hypothetical protein